MEEDGNKLNKDEKNVKKYREALQVNKLNIKKNQRFSSMDQLSL